MPPPGGGGGGGSGPNPPGGNHWDPFFNMPSVLVAKMKTEIRAEDIPEWDGRDSSALQWFADIQEFAASGGYVPWQMAPHMWRRLKEGSGPRLWFQNLPYQWKEWMRLHYLNFLTIVRSHYLGDRWLQMLNAEYRVQAFRQEGRTRENPLEFIQRRILYVRMLLHVPVGGPEEVREVMEKAPVAWKTILNSEAQPTVVHLQMRVRELAPQLLETARAAGKHLLTEDDIPSILRSLGVSVATRPTSTGRFIPRRIAAHAAAEEESGSYLEEVLSDSEDAPADLHELEEDSAQDSALTRELYAVTKKRQRPPPKGGYPFKKRDDIKSTVRSPPSPCKCCGSANHWDKECPWFGTWEAKYGRRVQMGEVAAVSEEWDSQDMYDKVFDEVNTIAAMSAYVDERIRSDRWVSTDKLVALGYAEPSDEGPSPSRTRSVTIEDVEEETQPPPGGASSAYLIEEIEPDNLQSPQPQEAEVRREPTVPPGCYLGSPKTFIPPRAVV